MKKHSGVPIIIALCIIPILLWYEPSVPIKAYVNFLSFGQILALVGAVLLSINFILSSRLKFLESLFGGLNKVYIIHHIVGGLALIFLSFHPIMVGLAYLPYSWSAVFSVLFPPIQLFAEWSGLIAYLILATLLVLTLYVNLPYHIWKLTHKFMGVVLVFAFIHILLIPSTVENNIPLRMYMLGVMGLAIVTYFYRTILGKFLVKRHDYKVEVVEPFNGVTKITLSPVSKPMTYTPGQFIFIHFESIVPSSEEHPFSLTSSPSEKVVSISPKESGDYTNTLKNLRVGTHAHIEGPFGQFSYVNSPRPQQIWIAGGIGITPFVSMAKSFTKDNGYDVILYYVTKTTAEAVYLNDLLAIAKKCTNIRVVDVHTDEDPRLTADIISTGVPDYKKRDIFICGPQPMMKDLRSQFNKLGIKNSHIFTEEFSID